MAGWFFLRNIILYNGDIFGLGIRSTDGELYADPGLKPSDRINNLGGSAFADGRISAVLMWLPKTVKSFIGNFGYLTLGLPIVIYVIYLLIFVAGLLSYLIFNKKFSFFQLILILAIIIPFILSIIYSFTEDYQPQGRYVITSALPIFYFITKGFESSQKKFKSLSIYRATCIVYYLLSAVIICYVGIVL